MTGLGSTRTQKTQMQIECPECGSQVSMRASENTGRSETFFAWQNRLPLSFRHRVPGHWLRALGWRTATSGKPKRLNRRC